MSFGRESTAAEARSRNACEAHPKPKLEPPAPKKAYVPSMMLNKGKHRR
jgi:hypothetical protein